jgi:transposase
MKVLIVFRSVNGYIINVTANLMETVYFLGIDISKETIQAALTLDGINMFEMEVKNTTKAIESYFGELKKKFKFSKEQLMVCLEHSGIYSNPLLDYLSRMEIKVCVESALQIKRSQGLKRGKSDQVDARRIAQYAYKNYRELRFWKPQRGVIQRIKALLVVRERLVKTKMQLATPLDECQDYIEESIRKRMVANCKGSLQGLAKDITKIEQEIDQLIQGDDKVKEQLNCASSVPGVGKITALNVIVATDEFEKISEVKKFACYAGVAPFKHTSGTSIRGRTRVSKMANMTLKKLLTLGAMSAIRWDEEIRVYYKRKVAAGKNKMSVINAVRNKLISRIFACVENKRLYQKVYQHALA